MCRWLAYQGEERYLDELLFQPDHSLVAQSMEASKAITSVNADGFGLGWYGDKRTPALYHEVLPAWSDPNLKSLAHHVKSRRFMAHVRASTGTNTSRENCHPFGVDNWMLMHNGQIPEFNKIRFALETRMQESFYLSRRGSTDSELIFLMLLQNGLRDNPEQAFSTVIEQIESLMQGAGIQAPLKASICVTDGNQFWGLRYSTDGVAPTMFYKLLDGGVVLASEPYENNREGWKVIPAQTFVSLNGENLDLSNFALE